LIFGQKEYNWVIGMKHQNGFIQMPLLAAIIAGVLILGGGGYFGIRQYQNYQAEKIKSKAQQKTDTDQNLEDIEILKKKIEGLEKQQQSQSKKIDNKLPSTSEINASEIDPYLTGVGEISCSNAGQDVGGSASLWNLGGKIGYVALTNYHVISGEGNCNLLIGDSSTDTKHSGFYRLDKASISAWNSDVDISALKITALAGAIDYSKPIPYLNYRISSLRKCSVRMQLGSPVVILGYPAFSKKNIDYEGTQGNQSFRTITNGIISAHDTSVVMPLGALPYSNYYVSAKIDGGNSGGIAFSKDNNGLCVLGVPTWLALGQYETQGIVQNIHNVFYKQ